MRDNHICQGSAGGVLFSVYSERSSHAEISRRRQRSHSTRVILHSVFNLLPLLIFCHVTIFIARLYGHILMSCAYELFYANDSLESKMESKTSVKIFLFFFFLWQKLSVWGQLDTRGQLVRQRSEETLLDICNSKFITDIIKQRQPVSSFSVQHSVLNHRGLVSLSSTFVPASPHCLFTPFCSLTACLRLVFLSFEA